MIMKSELVNKISLYMFALLDNHKRFNAIKNLKKQQVLSLWFGLTTRQGGGDGCTQIYSLFKICILLYK